MDAPKIPGWDYISDEAIDALPPEEYTLLDVQKVNGHCYVSQTENSLQKLVDEWIDGLRFKYHHGTATRTDGTVYGYVSDGKEAIRILKEHGLLDDKGRAASSPLIPPCLTFAPRCERR